MQDPNQLRRIDPRIIGFSQKLCSLLAMFALLMSVIIALGWLTSMGDYLFFDWWKMQLSTATLGVLLSLSALTPCARLKLPKSLNKVLAALALVFASAILVGYIQDQPLTFAGDFIRAEYQHYFSSTSPQSAVLFGLLSLSYILPTQLKGRWKAVQDAIVIFAVAAILFFVAGHLFGASAFIGVDNIVQISIPTLLVISALTVSRIIHRLPFSFFDVMAAPGVAGNFARLGIPITISLGFLVALFESSLVSSWGVPRGYSSALSASAMAILMFFIVIIMSRRIRQLEALLLDKSFRDDLTGLYNLAGLKSYSEHLQIGKGSPFVLIYFDLNGLKKVNDNLGHEVGSKMLDAFASILRRSFRDPDIIARVGGDEFVVMGFGTIESIQAALHRYEALLAEDNNANDDQFSLSASYGVAESTEPEANSLSALMRLADKRMYKMKREQKRPL